MPTEEYNPARPHQGVPQGVHALMHPLKILAATFGAGLLVWGLLFFYASSPAWAAIITVNSLADAADANTGGTFDGVCDTDAGTAGDQCTLRAAIQESNASAAVDDEINFSVNTVTLTIGGTQEDAAVDGDLDITESVTINGGGVVIGTDTTTFDERVFEVRSPAQATVSDVTIQGVRAVGPCDGAGFLVRSGAGLDLDGSTLRDNRAECDGGGISNDGGTLTVTDSTFDGNEAGSDGGGIRTGFGGTLTVTGSTFTENVADANESGTGFGGGLSVDGGTATVTNSTISGNTTFGTPSDTGGGVAVKQDADKPTLTLTNVTIADNKAPNSYGGGIGNRVRVDDGQGNLVPDPTAVQAKNTIVANNTQRISGQCATSQTTSGGVTSLGGNLEFPGTSCGFEVNADPGLGPLADNGGPTQTRALGEGSGAIDAGTNTGCPATDQRGVSRPQGSDCDIGSFELEEVAENQAPTVTVDGGGSCGSSSDMRGTINLALSDPDDPPSESLTLTASSSNRSVLPNSNISFGGGTDASRTMTVTSLTGSGTSNVTITLSDGDLKGTLLVRVLSGSASNNTLTGSALSEMIFARKGSDSVSAQGANDLMCGGNGNDRLTGGVGGDRFGGGSGTDTATDFEEGEGDTKAGIEIF